MADIRKIVTDSDNSLYLKLDPRKPPVPPSWYGGTPLFGYGKNPNFAEPLNQLPLSYTFSSPFVSGDTKDSYFTNVMTAFDIRATSGSRDLKELLPYGMRDTWGFRQYYQDFRQDPIFVKADMGFCVSIVRTHYNVNDSNDHVCSLYQLDVPSGGKVLTKQDFKLKARPRWYSSSVGYMTQAFGGYSLHEVGVIPAGEDYTFVTPRVCILWIDVNPSHQKPYFTNGDSYVFTTNPSKQMKVTADGRYWMNFAGTSYGNGNTASSIQGIVYHTDAGWQQCFVFVGEFSIKQLHDYITDTEKFITLVSGGNAYPPIDRPVGTDYIVSVMQPMLSSWATYTPYDLNLASTKTGLRFKGANKAIKETKNGVSKFALDEYPNIQATTLERLKLIDWVYSSNPRHRSPIDMIRNGVTPTDPSEKGSKIDQHIYVAGSYYQHIKVIKPPKLMIKGAANSGVVSGSGIFAFDFLGDAKIEAYTFNGAAPTPYKPVYLIERNTGRMIRETVSDKDGKYVLHGIPSGIEYVALSVDPTKTMNSTVEEFGVVE